MSTNAHLSAHKAALRTLMEFVDDKKDDVTNQAYLEASNALKMLHESAGAMARPSRERAHRRVADIEGRFRSPPPEEQWLSESDVEDDMNGTRYPSSRTLVNRFHRGQVDLPWFVNILRDQGAQAFEKVQVVDAIHDLVTGTTEQVTVRQTQCGQAGMIEAMATVLSFMDPSETSSLQIRILATLSALIRQHETNKELLGASGAFSIITQFMRVGPGGTEKASIRLLCDAGFQHTANQRAMLETNTIEAIMHLISQVRPIDRTEPVIKLLHQLLCPAPGAGSLLILGQQAIDQGAITLLLGKIYGGGATSTAIETLYQLFDENDQVKDRVASEGGLERLAAVLTNESSTLEDKAMSARALGELGANSFAHRRTIAALGVIQELKELETEPSGRRRHNFTFAIKRLDEEGNGSAARHARRAREQLEAERERKAKKANREAEKVERGKLRAELRKEIEERIKPTPAQLRKAVATPIAKKRVRK